MKRQRSDDYSGYGRYNDYSGWVPTPPIPGSSSNPISLDSPPPKTPAAKRQKKQKGPDAPIPEKRGAIFKKKCPKNILERVERVMSQRYATPFRRRDDTQIVHRFFMIDRKRVGTELKEEFSVLGSTGNVRTIIRTRKETKNLTSFCRYILLLSTRLLDAAVRASFDASNPFLRS